MYVINAQDKEIVSFVPPVQNYLFENGIPVIKKKNRQMYFRRSDRLRTILKNAPLWVRILSGGKEV